MSLKYVIVIIVIITLTTSMTEVKSTKLRIHEKKYGSQPVINTLYYQNYQTRHHNHLLHKKHYKCNLDRLNGRSHGHIKKQSRYPTLDKIVNRLDNQIDRGLNRIKITTYNPFDRWESTVPDTTVAPNKQTKNTYVTVGFKRGTTTIRNLSAKTDWMKEDVNVNPGGHLDNSITYNVHRKELLQDYTTSSPWQDNEQRDVFSQEVKNIEDTSNVLATSSTSDLQVQPAKELEEKKMKSFDELSFRSFGRRISRLTDVEDRKKKITKMPYVAAHEHYEQVLRIGDCHVPKEKVIRVHEVHPDPSKSYSPSCTILHQCGDDTGCCKDLKQVCKPKNTTKVELYFFTTTLGKRQTVEKLNFVNHTECECQRRTDDSMPRDSEFRSHLKRLLNINVYDGNNYEKNCSCPSRYSTRYLANGTCICDCFDKQDECLILKRGKSHFSYHDKLCIQQGFCMPPSCEFGSYIKQFGRCPNRRENYHYSWTRSLPYQDLIT